MNKQSIYEQYPQDMPYETRVIKMSEKCQNLHNNADFLKITLSGDICTKPLRDHWESNYSL